MVIAVKIRCDTTADRFCDIQWRPCSMLAVAGPILYVILHCVIYHEILNAQINR
jgi:hypothetical protein